MKKNLSIMLITLLLIMFAGVGICQAVGPDLGSGSYSGVDIDSEEPTSDIDADDPGVTGSTGVGPGPTGTIGPGANTQDTNTNTTNNTNINNTTNTTNNADTNINISGSTISNSNIGSNNKVTQTTNVSNTNSVTIKQEVSVLVNGQPLQSDTPSFINGDDRTMVTLRAIAEALGAKVDWDPSTQTITITLGDKVVKLVIGQNSFTVNGENKTSDTAPGIVGGRTVVPARVVGEALGASVKYEPDSKTVTVDKGDQQSNQPIFKPLPPIHLQPIDQPNQPSLQPPVPISPIHLQPINQPDPASQQGTQNTNQTTQTAQQTAQPADDWKARFPMHKSQTNDIIYSSQAVTSSTLYDSGRFEANTSVYMGVPMFLTVTVKVDFMDAYGGIMRVEKKSFILTDTLDLEQWSLNVPADILPQVADIRLAQSIEFTVRDNLTVYNIGGDICSDSSMYTNAFMDTTNGHLEGSTITYIQSLNPLDCVTGQVQAGLWDIKGSLLWTSQVYTYKVCGNLDAGYEPGIRTDKWVETVPEDIFYRAARLEIRQGHKEEIEQGKQHLFN